MPKICVIVPVYNAEKYLSHCVDSILNQTFRDFTLLLVDDCSVDKSASICDDYESKDGRVTVIHKEKNVGPGAARNTGIDWAFQNGGGKDFQYISFVDSDDFVSPIYLETLYSLILKYNTDISMCGFTFSETHKIQQNFLEHSCVAYCEEPEKLFCKYRVNCIVAWGKLYRTASFKNIRFPVDCLFGEDEAVIYRILFTQERIPFDSKPLYYYFQSKNSITRTAWSCKRLNQMEAILHQMRWLMYAGYEEAVKCDAQAYIYRLWREVLLSRKSHSEYSRLLKCQFQDALKRYAKLADITMWNSPKYYADAYSVLKPICSIRLLVSGVVSKFRS